jgi:hypothetical protein
MGLANQVVNQVANQVANSPPAFEVLDDLADSSGKKRLLLDGGYNAGYLFDLEVIWEKHADVL